MQVYQKAGRKYFVIDPGTQTCGLLEGRKPKGCSAVAALCAAMLEGSLMVGPFLPDDPLA